MSSYLRLKKPSFKDGKLKVRAEWGVEGTFLGRNYKYSDHYTIERSVGLNRWIKVADIKFGRLSVKVSKKEVCVKVSLDVPDPLPDVTLKECKKF